MAGDAAAGRGTHERAEQRIAAEARLDRHRVGVEPQDRPRGSDVSLDVGVRRDLEDAPVGQAAPVHPARHLLDPRTARRARNSISSAACSAGWWDSLTTCKPSAL